MNVIEKNIGPKIEYAVLNTRLSLRGELSVDLAKYERDFPVHMDICENEFGINPETGFYYGVREVAALTGVGRNTISKIDYKMRRNNNF